MILLIEIYPYSNSDAYTILEDGISFEDFYLKEKYVQTAEKISNILEAEKNIIYRILPLNKL